MRLAKLKILLPSLVIITALCTGASLASAIKQSALQAGQAWLQLIDRGQYAESWDQSSRFFKRAMAKQKWVDTLKAVRKPLGKSISRKVFSQKQHKELPGAPDGIYTIIKFNSSFEHKRNAVETITLALEPGGDWFAVGYFIR